MSTPLQPSARYYTPWALRIYDFWVLALSNSFAWACPTRTVLTPLFARYLAASTAHLDVGVGTGFYLSQPSTVPLLNKLKRLALLDLNPGPLAAAAARARAAGFKGDPELITHDVFRPLPEALHGQFDTISLFFVLHCLPGAFPTKASAVAAALLPALAPGPDAALYGATILGDAAGHNWFGRLLMRFYNHKGVFGNAGDTAEGLEHGFRAYFDEVEIEVVGRVALFVCTGPKSQHVS